jgi:RNA polymerase sigma-70 factor (ECF subfamily)
MDAMAITLTMPDATLRELERSGATASTSGAMDEDAFRAFYERTARPVWAYLRRITGDAHAADDLLQEAYYRFIRSGVVHESESHRRNALFLIATNVARDRARKHRGHHDVPLPDSDAPDAIRAPGNPAQQVESRMDLRRAMARLNPLQREVLWLAYAQGSSHQEISEVVGVRAANVKALLCRARRKLAELLRGKATEDGVVVKTGRPVERKPGLPPGTKGDRRD